jgi:hypothetical protein
MSNSKKNDNLKFKFSGKKTLYSLINQYSSSSSASSGKSLTCSLASLFSFNVFPSSVPFVFCFFDLYFFLGSIATSAASSGLGSPHSGSSSSKIFDLSILKYQMKELLSLSNDLDFSLTSSSSNLPLLLSYFQYVKLEIHKPYHYLLNSMKSLPYLMELERKLSIEYDAYLLQDKNYNSKIIHPSSSSANSSPRSSVFPSSSSGSNAASSSSSPAKHGKVLFKVVEMIQEYQLLLTELIKLLNEYSLNNQLSSNRFYLNEITHLNNTKILSVPQKELIKTLFSIKSENEIKDCFCNRNEKEIEEAIKAITLYL